jgi:hypothetical protein
MPINISERLRHPLIHDIVTIIEHPDCSGSEGTVIQIDQLNNIKVRCKTCLSTNVFIDRTFLRPRHLDIP